VVEVRTNFRIQETLMENRYDLFKNNDKLMFGNYGLSIDDFWKNTTLDLTDVQRFGYQTYRNSLLPYSKRTDASKSNGLILADINCGKGHALKYLQEEFKFEKIHGYQPDSDLHSLAVQNAPEATIFKSPILASKKKDYYDIIISVNSIMHEDFPMEVFKRVFGKLKTGGRFIFVDKVKISMQDEYLAWIKNMTRVIGYTHESHEDLSTLSRNASEMLASTDHHCSQFYGSAFMDMNYGRFKIYRDVFVKK
jgi:SAM-dependent methyltransferase